MRTSAVLDTHMSIIRRIMNRSLVAGADHTALLQRELINAVRAHLLALREEVLPALYGCRHEAAASAASALGDTVASAERSLADFVATQRAGDVSESLLYLERCVDAIAALEANRLESAIARCMPPETDEALAGMVRLSLEHHGGTRAASIIDR